MAATLTELIEDFAARRDAPALRSAVDGAVRDWSYAELHEFARRVAAGLRRRGVKSGDHVVLMAASRPEWVFAALGVILSGGVLVPIDSQLRGATLAYVLGDCDAVIAVADAGACGAIAAAVPRPPPLVALDAPDGATPDAAETWSTLLAEERGSPTDTAPASPAPEAAAVMFYTSGTTGAPKGVPLTHRNLCFQIETLRTIDLATPDDRCLVALPLHHVYPFVVGMLTSFGYGMCLVLPAALQGPQILNAMQLCRATILIGVPRLYDILLATLRDQVRARGRAAAALFGVVLALGVLLRRWLGLHLGRWLFGAVHARLGPDIRMVVSGGAALDPATAWTLEGLGWTLAGGYGLTETAPLISFLLPGDRRFDAVGRPVPGIEVRTAPVPGVVDPGVGEIQVRGPGVFSGYHNLPDRSAGAFTADGWFRTDDLGCLDSDGRLHVLGRASTLIVTPAGENVQPEAVEEAYERHPLIREVGVLRGGDGLAAVIVPADGAADEATLRAAVQQAARDLPSYWRLTDLVPSHDALARTRLGKIRRAELRLRFETLKRAGGALAGVLPREQMTDADKDLIDHPAAGRVWDWLARRYAGRRLTPDSSPTLDLGIDSLEWMGVALELRRLVGIELSEAATGRIETVRDLLVEVLRAADAAATPVSGEDDPEALLTARQRRWLAPLGPIGRLSARLLHALNRALARLLFGLEVAGRENLPETGPFVIAPNHASVLDPFALAAALDYAVLRGTSWAAWTGMAFKNPFFRLVSRLAQALPVEVDRAAFSSLALGLAALGAGRNLVWFPEGGRSRDGRLQPFKLGTGMLLAKANVPVVPVAIHGTFDAMPTGRRLPRLRRVRVTIGVAVTPAELARRGEGDTPEARMTDGLRGVLAGLVGGGTNTDRRA